MWASAARLLDNLGGLEQHVRGAFTG